MKERIRGTVGFPFVCSRSLAQREMQLMIAGQERIWPWALDRQGTIVGGPLQKAVPTNAS
jgi:hypothetical protein